MKAFIIIATGRPVFGQMALTLCLSIKCNEPSAKTILLYSTSAIQGNEERIARYFDFRKDFDVFIKNPATSAHWLKLQAFNFAKVEGFSECIILDADTLILPGKKPSEWFDECGETRFHTPNGLPIIQERSFVPYINDTYNYVKKEYKYSKDGHEFWCDPEKAKEHFAITHTIMPQINASFIYFKVNDIAEGVFRMALEAWNDEDFKDYISVRGTKSEEMCFNIAMAQVQVLLPSVPYRPLYIQGRSTTIDRNYIQHRFTAFTMAGNLNHDQRVVSLYNELSDYYMDHFGIKERFHFNQDMKLIKEQRPIIGFWHVCMINNWEKVVREQLDLLVKHGLYNEVKFISVCAVGRLSDFYKLVSLLKPYPKLKLNHPSDSIEVFEFPTLELLKTYARLESHFGFYIHTKGVSNPKGDHWRDYLNYFNIVKWRECQHFIRSGYDLCGVKLIQAGAHPMHYSGNFWHYDSDYIQTLKPISSLNHQNRYEAEMWVCSGNPRAATLSQKMIDHYNKEKFKPSFFDKLKKLLRWQ